MSELDRVPALGPLFAKAVLARKRAKHTEAVSDDRLTVEDQAVDADRLWHYQRLCGFRVGDLLPPTYLHLMTFPLAVARMVRSDFPFPLLGLVHVGNTVIQHRPVSLTERVGLAAWAEQLRPHPSGLQVDLVSEARVDGELVWHETSSYLHRRGSTQQPSGPRAEQASPRAEQTSPRTEQASPRTEQGTGGGPAIRWQLPADLGRRYGAVSGDRNPIHLHNLSARAFGFPKAIAHGMWLQARTLAAFEGRLPASYTAEVAFKTPAFLPSEVELTATPAAGGWELQLRNAKSGKPHLAGTIRP